MSPLPSHPSGCNPFSVGNHGLNCGCIECFRMGAAPFEQAQRDAPYCNARLAAGQACGEPAIAWSMAGGVPHGWCQEHHQ